MTDGRNRKYGKYDAPLIGRVFGRLTVIKRVDVPVNTARKYRREFICECVCGAMLSVALSNLKANKTGSCGCLRADLCSDKNAIGDGVDTLMRRYSKVAQNYNRIFSLNKEEFQKLTSEHCHYCGRPPSKSVRFGRNKYVYNGIDRIDSARGYEPGNVLPCCPKCNQAKSNLSYRDFLAWIKRVYTHLELKVV